MIIIIIILNVTILYFLIKTLDFFYLYIWLYDCNVISLIHELQIIIIITDRSLTHTHK